MTHHDNQQENDYMLDIYRLLSPPFNTGKLMEASLQHAPCDEHEVYQG